MRAKIFGTPKTPRLCVFRSNQHIYAQLINDEKGETLASASDLELNEKRTNTETHRKTEKQKRPSVSSEKISDSVFLKKALVAYEVGKLVAQKANSKKIKKVVFDRGGYKYHGRVKAVAEGARKGGLKF